MTCRSCQTPLSASDRVCPQCGSPAPSPVHGSGSGTPVPEAHRGSLPAQLRSCPACGHRGEGMAYFQRSTNLALLGVATILTYGFGGLAYWLLKRRDRVCPSCGLSWDRSRPMGPASPSARGGGPSSSPAPSPVAAGAGPPPPAEDVRLPEPTGPLPPGGMVRRVSGVLVGLTGLLFVVVSIFEGTPGLAAFFGAMALGGALLYGWGWTARRDRRQALMERTQRTVIHLARVRGGRLTATDVATALDMSLPAAERILLSLDDGFRVRSEITRDGILVFDFPEVSLSARTRDAEVVDWNRALDEGRERDPDAGAGEADLEPSRHSA